VVITASIALMMEAASVSETSANFYQTTRSMIGGTSHLHTRQHESLKFHDLFKHFIGIFSHIKENSTDRS
jgi:hypothetical protein